MAPDDTSGGSFSSQSYEERNEFLEYWHIVRERWPIILGLTLLAAASGAAYMRSLPNIYTASADIMIARVGDTATRVSDQVQLPTFLPDEQDDYTFDYYGTQISILKSSKIREQVQATLGSGIPPYEMTANRLRKTSIITIIINCGDPSWAARIANAFADIFVKEGAREQLFITEQLLNYIPDSIEHGSDLNKSVLGKTTASRLTDFNKNLFAEQLNLIAEDPVIVKARTEKLEAEAKLRELLQIYLPYHPEVQGVLQKLAHAQETLKGRTAALLTNLRASLTGQLQISNVRVVEEAVPPRKPSAPDRAKGILIAALLGLAASSITVITLHNVLQRVKTQDDLKQLKILFLGYVPKIRDLKRAKKSSLAPFSLHALMQANPVLADAVSTIRTCILFSIPYERSKRIMIVSALPNEGKSTFAVLLAIALASLGRKILLVEADLRKPSISKYLPFPPSAPGLAEYLAGKASIDEVMLNGPIETLKVIKATREARVESVPELLSSERFRTLLNDAGEKFDRVLIDVPPVLYIPDGLIVAKNVHTGVLVCRSGMAHRRTVKTVMEKFDAIHFSLIGTIINQSDHSKEQYNYGYKSYYSYYTEDRTQQKTGRRPSPKNPPPGGESA